MVDKSDYICSICKHRQNDHSKHFARCYKCEDYHKSGMHDFKLLPNLEFLEWYVKQKEKIR